MSSEGNVKKETRQILECPWPYSVDFIPIRSIL